MNPQPKSRIVSLLKDAYDQLGVKDPRELEVGTGITFQQEHSMTPDWLIDQLPKKEQWIFRKLFAGKMAKKIYRLYEFC